MPKKSAVELATVSRIADHRPRITAPDGMSPEETALCCRTMATWPSSCAYRRKVGLIRKRSCGRSPVNQCAKLACRWKTLPRSVTVREARRAGGRKRSRLLRDAVSP
jgi:hypothetical protein